MHPLHRRSPSRALALVLVLAAGCENQITQPPARLQPSDVIQADKAAFKSVIALEPLPGASLGTSSAFGNNDLGQIVGQSTSSAGIHAVIWDNSAVPQDLGTLPGGTSSAAVAISNDGRVIVGNSYGPGIQPVRWLKSNGQWLIDALSYAGTPSCTVVGISSDGTAIAGNCAQSTDPNSAATAVIWRNGNRIDLGFGTVSGVNAKGQAVVNYSNLALLWTFGTGPSTLADLGTLGGAYTVANGINDAGEVTGWSERVDHESHAFLWSPKKSAMTDLGAIGGTSGGYGINGLGQAVGDVWPGGSQHAGFFDHGKVVDLGALPGYTNAIAVHLNNNGQAVGASYGSGLARATMWTLK
jgi:probable HAF family extracellular repeat protein